MSEIELNGWTQAEVKDGRATVTQEVFVGKTTTIGLTREDVEALLEEM